MYFNVIQKSEAIYNFNEPIFLYLRYCKHGKTYLTPIVQLPLSRIIHIHYIEQNNIVPTRVARSSYEIIALFSSRAGNFFFHALARHRAISRCFASISRFIHFNITFRGLIGPGIPIRRRLDRDIKKKALRAGCLAQLQPPRTANCLLPGLITSLCYSVNARRKPLCLPRLNSRLAHICMYI